MRIAAHPAARAGLLWGVLALPAGAAETGAEAGGRAGFAAGFAAGFTKCRALEDDLARVRCYDRLAAVLSPPRFQGRLTAQTEAFEVAAPTTLRFESDGPIFVMYLKDGAGDVVQNLHIGGGGSATYRIERPGTYSLMISGSETWRVWLEPMS